MPYKVWTPGDKRPHSIPKGCQFFSPWSDRWMKESDRPSSWGSLQRRWPTNQLTNQEKEPSMKDQEKETKTMIYEMYDPKDESTRPETLPQGCEAYIFHADEWTKEKDSPDRWKHCLRRWPAEQRPTAYGLLTDEEKDELKVAYSAGKTIEWYNGERYWNADDDFLPDLYDDMIYRIQPEPTVEITVKVNGKLVNPTTLSKESWAALRKKD